MCFAVSIIMMHLLPVDLVSSDAGLMPPNARHYFIVTLLFPDVIRLCSGYGILFPVPRTRYMYREPPRNLLQVQ